MTTSAPWRLFERIGVELEYMIVDSGTLAVSAIADRILPPGGDREFDDPDLAGVCWSNELTSHVIELKVAEPASSLAGLARQFQRHVARVDAELAPHRARLMPGGMHPWMDPAREMRLWPHENGPVYHAFNRVFGCAGHGWANLQSCHINLPFGDDEEFARLHAAIRLILPILPALAAASPFIDGRATGALDNRLAVYAGNARRVPSVAGDVIPEPLFSPAAYRRGILDRMYRDIAPHDPDGVLQHEWLNARGAIARFDRGAIEIRLLDAQECPQADVAIVSLVVAALRELVAQRWSPLADQQAWPVEPLAAILKGTILTADACILRDRDYLRMFGCPTGPGDRTAGDLWRHLAEWSAQRGLQTDAADSAALRVILTQGPLARRLLRAVGTDLAPASSGTAIVELPHSPPAPAAEWPRSPAQPVAAAAEAPNAPSPPSARSSSPPSACSPARLHAVYAALCDCLSQGRMFSA